MAIISMAISLAFSAIVVAVSLLSYYTYRSHRDKYIAATEPDERLARAMRRFGMLASWSIFASSFPVSVALHLAKYSWVVWVDTLLGPSAAVAVIVYVLSNLNFEKLLKPLRHSEFPSSKHLVVFLLFGVCASTLLSGILFILIDPEYQSLFWSTILDKVKGSSK